MKETKPAPSRARRSDRSEFDASDEAATSGMSPAGTAADEAETMASIGNSEGTFTEITTGTATGLGLDRGASMGTGGLAAGEDLDAVAEGDYWRQNFRRRPYSDAGKPYEHYAPGDRFDWESGEDAEDRQREPEDVESELERSWDARHGEHAREREEK